MPAIWDLPDFDSHEAVHVFDDRKTGLKAVIAVHSTHLGPAAGGTRFWHYADTQMALTDALRLSRGMSYKNAMAGLPAGGGHSLEPRVSGALRLADESDGALAAADGLGRLARWRWGCAKIISALNEGKPCTCPPISNSKTPQPCRR